MNLYPYQAAGRDHLAKNRAALLLDDPGLGKTAQAIRAAAAVGAKRVLVVCPAVARVSWEIEVPKWRVDPTMLVRVVSYEGMVRDLKALTSGPRWDVVAFDEGQYLKSPTAKRTKAAYGGRCDRRTGLAAHADRVWVLTGTLCPNNASEAWTHLRALFPAAIRHPDFDRPMTHGEFVDRYCVTVDNGFGFSIVGSKNQKELRRRMAPYVLRRRKQEVLQDLPPISFTNVPVSLSPHDRRAVADLDDELAEALAGASTDDEAAEALERAALAVSSMRRTLGLLKAPACAAWAHEFLSDNPGRKLILFAVHTAVIDLLMEVLGSAGFNPVRVDGRDGVRARIDAVSRFQQDNAVRVFVGQVQAAGTAITLTAASDVAMCEASWTPADNYQAACRAHRIGQRDGVLVRFLFVPGTLDERVQAVLRRKAQDISQIFE